MSKEDKKVDEKLKEKEGGTPAPAEAKNTEDPTPGPIPYDRFREVNERNKELAEQLKALKEAEEAREAKAEAERQKRLKEQAEYQTLAEEWEAKYNNLAPQADAATKTVEEYKQALEKFADAQMDLVPELFRDVVKALPVMERLQWLADNQSKLKEPSKKGIPTSPNGERLPELDEKKRRQRAARTF